MLNRNQKLNAYINGKLVKVFRSFFTKMSEEYEKSVKEDLTMNSYPPSSPEHGIPHRRTGSLAEGFRIAREVNAWMSSRNRWSADGKMTGQTSTPRRPYGKILEYSTFIYESGRSPAKRPWWDRISGRRLGITDRKSRFLITARSILEQELAKEGFIRS